MEEINQIRILQAQDCDLVQRYFFSKPVPADQLIEVVGVTLPRSTCQTPSNTIPALLRVESGAGGKGRHAIGIDLNGSADQFGTRHVEHIFLVLSHSPGSRTVFC